ncbi:hypothetical protein E4U36_006194, partial [Claviceps purpurea]
MPKALPKNLTISMISFRSNLLEKGLVNLLRALARVEELPSLFLRSAMSEKQLDSISLEQNMKLRVNNKDVAKPDSHGDIWLHI